MAGLANIFDASEGEPSAARGPDLRVTAEVPRAGLGHGVRVAVPQRLAADGDLVERVVDAADPERVTLHLPDELPPGAVLRLRGQGGVGRPGERPGDLFVVVELVDRPAQPGEIVPGGSQLPDAPSPASPVEPGRDVTWMVLLGLAVAAGGAVAATAFLL